MSIVESEVPHFKEKGDVENETAQAKAGLHQSFFLENEKAREST